MKYFEAHDVREYKDANGDTPEILMIDGNRAAGKTTAFSRKLVNDFKDYGRKFMLVYRYANEIQNISDSFFKDIHVLFFPDDAMTEKRRANGAYTELFLNGNSCGYAVALNTSRRLKNYSHMFSDVYQMFFDEYQLENGSYITDEITKFISLHMTVARGRGEVVRFVPVYMCSNSISIFNPYYDAFGIADKIRSNTKVLKGNGFVLLRLTLKEVQREQEKSAFNRAFAGSPYMQSANDNSFLNDDTYNVMRKSLDGYRPLIEFRSEEKPYTIFTDGERFHVREGNNNVPYKFGAAISDRDGDYISIKSSVMFTRVRYWYQDGIITFENVKSKAAFMRLIFSNS